MTATRTTLYPTELPYPAQSGHVAAAGKGALTVVRPSDVGVESPGGVAWDMSLDLTSPLPNTVLAVGADLKNTVCYAGGHRAWVGEANGDLAIPDGYRRLFTTVRDILAEGSAEPPVLAHDLHPGYLSTNLARSQSGHKVGVQHHHAHAVSCAADAGVALPVIGIVCDGTGYGTDGAIWGGEVLLCEAGSFERMAHLDYFDLPGGDAAARFPWRPAVSLLRASFPGGWRRLGIPALDAIDPNRLDQTERQLDVGLNVAASSSLGRLFDAVSFLAGLCVENHTEGQAAIALQKAAEAAQNNGPEAEPEYPFAMRTKIPSQEPIPDNPRGLKPAARSDAARIDWRPMIRALVEDVVAGAAAPVVAARFHTTVAAMFADAAEDAAARSEVPRVVLSGGCFMNGLLREGLATRLRSRGLSVAVHKRVSCGDAGLSLGQAVIAAQATAASSPSAQGAY